MAIKRAAIQTPEQIDRVVDHIRNTSTTPERDELMYLLSHLAGLRVGEIAKLSIDTAFLDAEGRIPLRNEDRTVRVMSNVAKKGRERTVPMHPRVAQALRRFIERYPGLNHVAFSQRNPRQVLSDNALTVWFFRLYKAAGMQNCSSHSGRRSFATRSARMLANHGQSLKDLQMLLGHAKLETTEAYLEPTDTTRNLIAAL